MKSRISTRHLAYAALVGAMSFVIMHVTQISIFAAAPYLKLELSEAPILLISVIVSPGVGLLSLIVKDALGVLFSGYNLFGVSADVIMAGVFILLFTYLLRGGKTFAKVLTAAAVAAAGRMLVSIPVNLIVLWLEFGTPASAVFAAMPFILPFNLIKCVINAACFYLLYPRLSRHVIK